MHNMKNEIFEQKQCILGSFKHNNEKIKKIAQYIKENNIDKIVLVARGSSDNAAAFGKYALEIFSGIPVMLAAPSVISIYKKELKLEKTCVIAVSQSGQSEDICQFVKHANDKEAFTVAITNNKDSKLNKVAQENIYMEIGPEKAVAATKSFTAEVLLLEMLAAYLGDNEEIIACLNNIDKIIEEALLIDEKIQQEITRFRYLNECFILGRGLTYPIALEFALKVQETSYIRAKGFSISDFMHGPIAMIDTNIPVFLLAFNDETAKNSIEVTKELYEKNIDIIAFSDCEELKKYSTIYFELNNNVDEYLKPFVIIPQIQLFSYYLSILKGNNPDKPRLLNKVTITE